MSGSSHTKRAKENHPKVFYCTINHRDHGKVLIKLSQLFYC